ncbi:hypothetical protein PsorP6_001011 [Peronosclerospora sorghi]|uniref:Uncharacterized protein n=1 Tax=Peronosclerospora sorghi TaxID=230839 RepID=A0ACC0WS70_9STRA|nr:hypothetical protein PsorP6_001011 [Peronosclerospora sorghi]
MASIEFFLFVLCGIVITLAGVSMLLYCLHRRRHQQVYEYDNVNNNIQRHLLEDSIIQEGKEVWQCSVCYHVNHPAKNECLMCGTSQVISQGSTTLTVVDARDPSAIESTESQETLGPVHVSPLNEMDLNQRQRGARRRHLWQREIIADGYFRWIRVGHCQPSRQSQLAIRTGLPSAAIFFTSRTEDEWLSGHTNSLGMDRLKGLFSITKTDHTNRGENKSVEADSSRVDFVDADGKYSRTIEQNVRDSVTSGVLPTSVVSMDDGLVTQSSIGYLRHVNNQGHAEWISADCLVHECSALTSIDTEEFPRASSFIDFESIVALPFKLKVKWLLEELNKVAVPLSKGHLLLQIGREAVMGESMHLLMLITAADLRQRLRIEFIGEPGLDGGGLLREWVLILCEQLFSESYGLFQQTHGNQSGYWINPNSRDIHPDHLHGFQFVGRLLAKCLLEGQLLTVHLALPLLKHLLGVPISFSDLEFLDAEFYRHARWLRDNEGADALEINFTTHRQAANGKVITEELKAGGKDILVSDANKKEYLTLLLKHKMFGEVQEQLEALLRGLYDVLPRTLLAVFDYQELELLLCGAPSIDVVDWESHTDVRYLRAELRLNGPERQVVLWFWEAVRSFSQEQRARLLQFVTGTSRVPAEGFRALLSHDGRIRRFCLQIVPIDAGLYPKAHTCFNRLYLPIYRSLEELVTYLTLVINIEITGFTMQ